MPQEPLIVDNERFIADYAKTGRSTCKRCQKFISKSDLRIAHLVPSPRVNRDMALWYHLECLFRIGVRPKRLSQIDNLFELKDGDISSIKGLIDSTSSSPIPPHEGLIAGYAKSSRSHCKQCHNVMNKGDLRLGVLYRDETKQYRGALPDWCHAECFFSRGDVGQLGIESIDDFLGMSDLQSQDRKSVEELTARNFKSKNFQVPSTISKRQRAKSTL